MNWEFDFEVFSRWEDGNYFSYGVNTDGSDWICEIFLRNGKFYTDLEDSLDETLAIENSKDRIKALAINPKKSLKDMSAVLDNSKNLF